MDPVLLPIYNFTAVVRLEWKALKGARDGSNEPRFDICGIYVASIDEDDGETAASIVNFGNVALSRDGEVRSPSISKTHFNVLMDYEFWDAVEQPFIQYVDKASLDTYFYFPSIATQEERDKFKKMFFDARYDFKIAMAHFYHLLELYRDDITKHSPVSFGWIKPDLERLVGIVHEVESSFGEFVLRSKLRDMTPTSLYVTKIIPITHNELQHINDIRYQVWRECYVQTMSFQLRHSFVTQSFTRYHPWAMIHDIDENMFMNPYVLARFLRGSAVHDMDNILKSLENREQELHQPGETTPFEPQQHNFHLMVQHASGNLELSNVAILCESVLISRAFTIRTPQDFNELCDIIFSWSYVFLVLHTHIGVIHADAHLGNLRIQSSAVNPPTFIDSFAYIPKSRMHGLMIDFSRTIINPFFEPIQSYTTASPDVIAQEQGKSLMSFFLSVFPAHPSATRVERLINEDFNRAFHILSILDPMFMIMSIRALIKNGEAKELIERLFVKCTSFLATALEDPGKVDISSFPLRAIIIEHFEMKSSEKPQMDIANFNSPFIYPSIDLDPQQAMLLSRIITEKK